MRTYHSLIFILLVSVGCNAQQPPLMSTSELEWLAQRIYQNECNQQEKCLTSWNSGEDFPSLGIGHFIWYQQGQQASFEETFPTLIEYMQEQQIAVPAWIIEQNLDSPWPDRITFLNALNGPRLTELREFLLNHQGIQADFIVKRFMGSINTVTSSSTTVSAATMEARVSALASASSPLGLFALIDYVHFKGTGLVETERYNNQGWGLVQVLENMNDSLPPLNSFVASARIILENRVINAPAERNEQRWLKGWHNRLEGYLPETLQNDF